MGLNISFTQFGTRRSLVPDTQTPYGLLIFLISIRHSRSFRSFKSTWLYLFSEILQSLSAQCHLVLNYPLFHDCECFLGKFHKWITQIAFQSTLLDDLIYNVLNRSCYYSTLNTGQRGWEQRFGVIPKKEGMRWSERYSS